MLLRSCKPLIVSIGYFYRIERGTFLTFLRIVSDIVINALTFNSSFLIHALSVSFMWSRDTFLFVRTAGAQGSKPRIDVFPNSLHILV